MTASITLEQQVYFEDIDVSGVVHHPNYFNYFERARTMWLRQHGIDSQQLHDDNCFFAIIHADINYLKALRLDDHISITADLKPCSAASVIFEQRIYQTHHSDIINATASIKIVTINDKAKAIRLPTALRELL